MKYRIADLFYKNKLKVLFLIFLTYFCILCISALTSILLAIVINAITFIVVVCITSEFILEKNKILIKQINQYREDHEACKRQVASLEVDLSKAIEYEKIQKEKNQIEEELTRSTSFNHHLAGVISGLNHELSPWITGIYLLACRMQEFEQKPSHVEMLKKIEMASIQTNELLDTLSKNVNKVKNFSVFKTNVKDTVGSWVQLVLLDRTVKDKISGENIHIDYESLDFIAEHSPMYLSQIILNLAKNSIDHNEHMLETLKINIYGNVKHKQLIYEDNGKGIPKDILVKVFKNFGVTTKKSTDNGEIHGFGLYSCLNYCLAMKATIVASSSPKKGTKFVINFERIDENNEIDESEELN